MTAARRCPHDHAVMLPPHDEDCREQCPECGELGACEECLTGGHDDCLEPAELRQTRETGAWCFVQVCCCGALR